LLALLLVSFALQTRQVAALERDTSALAQAQNAAGGVNEVRLELDRMRGFQERLLTMLGVEPTAGAAEDSLAPWAQLERLPTDDRLRQVAAAVMTPAPDLWPTSGYVTKEFTVGARARGVLPHQGIDIAGPRENPIRAAGDGVVYRTGTDPYLGNFVEIEHGLGYLTVYGHCSRVLVARGDHVRRGEVIAHVGDTGQTTAPHLHFEIWREGEAVDPREFLQGEPPRQ
jgi:murein DD-endopeptidase MepM/ murein hydrolase activator NlpD